MAKRRISMEVLKELDKMNYTFVKSYPLSHVITMSDDEIRLCVYTIVVDYETLTNHFDKFLRVIKILKEEGTTVINCETYDCIKFINEHYKERFPMIINVLDDYQNKDRSDIKLSKLDKTIITIPIPHLMWGIDFDNLIYLNSVTYNQNALFYNGNKEISLDDLKRIKDVIEALKDENLSDAQKLLVVSTYLQRNVQYVDNTPNLKINGVEYELDDPSLTKEILIPEVGLIETIINKHYGLCMGIANTTTVLLNNPEMNIDARTLVNENHAWNIIKIDGKYYYCDNTWAISRNPHLLPNAIMTTEFSSTYLLFGQRSMDHMKEHNLICSDNPNLKNISYTDYRLKRTIRKSKDLITSGYSKSPVLTMHRKV